LKQKTSPILAPTLLKYNNSRNGNSRKTTWKKGQAPQSTSYFPRREFVRFTNTQIPGSVIAQNETKPLGSATLLKAFFAGFLTCPQRSISRVESIKKKCFKQVVVQIHCKTEEYDYNQPAIKIR